MRTGIVLPIAKFTALDLGLAGVPSPRIAQVSSLGADTYETARVGRFVGMPFLIEATLNGYSVNPVMRN